ncbi:hypothetical protein Sjap_010076 [Stephania japonica]|uniref:Uncharacterized protein n=1 Tax=Stephania japonica TaxID=461633 RepID=A0AAP0J8X7_9MAGN
MRTFPAYHESLSAGKKQKVSVLADGDELYELEGSESAIKGSRKIYHSDNFRVLDKAATLTEKEMTDPSKQNTWKLHQAAFFHLDWTATPPSQVVIDFKQKLPVQLSNLNNRNQSLKDAGS